jgi:predicted nucleic acid-binding protein
VSFLLDTNVLSELRKKERTNTAVTQWIASVDADDLFLSVLVVGELHQGIERLRRRDPVAARKLDRWLTVLTESYAERILAVDLDVATLWGRLNVPDPLPAVDGLLAATAIVRNLTLVTRNTSDVRRTGVRLLNPFEKGQ